ncbi:unnamed protein product [Prunus armeniaca]|uniref:Uncharacterized protein n=1 Tax=Prunus armeniaca TaxID=36596 RepID=A0A6J5WM15_PRUAR|nr:unnamed protein product [Prunus armeniaca]
MGRSPCCSKDESLNRGAWTGMEDKILREYIRVHGEGKWRNLPKRAGLKRCGKSCRLRWLNYLRPDIKRGNITRDEEELIIRLHKLLGNRWSLIAGRLPGRTDNEIKNYWNTTIGKKIQGHPFADGNRKPPNQTQENPKPTQPPKVDTNSCTKVVRTKASRCTKVFIPQEAQILMTKFGTTMTTCPIMLHSWPLTSSCEFMVDFKMDENFLSDFLNVDFSELYNNGNDEGGSVASATTCDKVPDFQSSSMAPVVDYDLDWLIDNTAHY